MVACSSRRCSSAAVDAPVGGRSLQNARDTVPAIEGRTPTKPGMAENALVLKMILTIKPIVLDSRHEQSVFSFGQVLGASNRRHWVVPSRSRNRPAGSISPIVHTQRDALSSTNSAEATARWSYPRSIHPRTYWKRFTGAPLAKGGAGWIAPAPLNCSCSRRPAREGKTRTRQALGRGRQNRSDGAAPYGSCDTSERVLLSSLWTPHHRKPTTQQGNANLPQPQWRGIIRP